MIYVKVELVLSTGHEYVLMHSFVIPFKTIIDYGTHIHIQSGDTLVFGNNILLIKTICHYGPNTSPMTPCGEPLFLTEPLVYTNEHDLLLAFDEFKNTFELMHLGAAAPPKSYYLLYRSLMGININNVWIDIPGDGMFNKVVTEVLRAIFIAEFPDDEFDGRFTESSTYIEWLYQIMIENDNGVGIDLLNVINQWEPMINGPDLYDGSLKWTTDKQKLMMVIGKVFARSRVLRDRIQYLS